MKRLLPTLIIVCLTGIMSLVGNGVFLYDKVNEEEPSFIIDGQRADKESFFDVTRANKTILPELHNLLPSPSFRIVSSSKKSQQNTCDAGTLRKRFVSETITKNFNITSFIPLSTKDNLVVTVRHLRI